MLHRNRGYRMRRLGCVYTVPYMLRTPGLLTMSRIISCSERRTMRTDTIKVGGDLPHEHAHILTFDFFSSEFISHLSVRLEARSHAV